MQNDTGVYCCYPLVTVNLMLFLMLLSDSLRPINGLSIRSIKGRVTFKTGGGE